MRRVGEELKVGKRTVGAGEVKLHKTIATEQVNVSMELKREDIVVERVPAHEVESGKEPFQEEHIKVQLSQEDPVVKKDSSSKEVLWAFWKAPRFRGSRSMMLREKNGNIDIRVNRIIQCAPTASVGCR